MDVEFHYYVNYIVAIAAGIPKEIASIISYSSQYVDDNTEYYRVKLEYGKYYENEISQSFCFTDSFRDIEDTFCCFHFLPGYSDSSNRKDEKVHHLSTVPESFLSRIVIRNAIQSKDPYIIGVASHAFADTWAHQNFTGTWNEFNSFDTFPSTLVPSIGHADAFDKPDLAGVRWKDKRLLNSTISNNSRFLDAALALFDEYIYIGYKPLIEANTLKAYLKKIFGRESSHHNILFRAFRTRRRMKLYKLLAQKISGECLEEYDSSLWLDDVLIFEGQTTVFRNRRYKNSHWYNFQEAVKYHRSFVHALIKNIEAEKCNLNRQDLNRTIE